MAFGSLWHRWRRRFLAFSFIVQYHFRLTLLSLLFKARTLSRADIDARARASWNKLCHSLAAQTGLTTVLRSAKQKLENEYVTAALRFARQKLESERWQTALQAAKKRLEETIFTEEARLPRR